MFIDKAKIKLQAGKGGNGIVAFITEKYVPRGGPGGGNGGDGGSIIFQADEGINTLFNLRYKKIITSNNGENGRNKKQHGKNAKDVIIKVPCGTIVKENGIIIADFSQHKQQQVMALGGPGGRGNASFATSKNPAPRICENGSLGEIKDLEIELLLLADVGIMGFPSVGKSTFLSVVSNAKPVIADYEFTTINPQIGIVEFPHSQKGFVMADLPGLIQGSSKGKGLGFQFLKHLSRCKLILHMIDVSEYNPRKNVINDYNVLRKELFKYDLKLYNKPEIIVASKSDGDKAPENILKLAKEFPNKKIFPISSILQKNIKPLLLEIKEELKKIKHISLFDQNKEKEFVYHYNYKNQINIKILNKGNGVFEVKGKTITDYLHKNPMNTDQNIKRFYQFLEKIKLEEKLISKGAKENDTIKIGTFQLELKI